MTDYKEKYEKAVQAAMLAKQDTESAVTIGSLETIFPELRESDGARAKREIIDFLKCCCEKEVIKAIDAANWIAWLEKKGEQNIVVVIPKFRVGDVIRPKGSAVEYTIESISGECYHGKGWGMHISCDDDYELVEHKPAEPILSKEVDSQIWQIANNAGITYDQSFSLLMATKKAYDKGKEDAIKEQKPAKWSEYDNEMFLHCCAAIRVADYSSIDDRNMMEKWFRNLKDRVQPQPKQEWSEEDEKYWSVVIAEFSKCAGKSVSKDEWMRCNDWLNSLRDRVQPQPKQEWSEEDRGNLLDVKCIIDEVWHNQYVREEIDHSGEELESLWHWLNKLLQRVEYPQNRWKPSEEQMDALETAASSLQSTTLESLYNELKKL